MIKLFAFIGLLTLSQAGFAKTMCICQTGTKPVEQIKFFQAGCKAWLLTKSCDEKKTLPADVSLDENISDDFSGGTVQLGYIGHWGSSGQSNKFMQNDVIPVAQKKNLDFTIDNTACDGMSNAFEVQTFLKSLKDNGFKNKIEYKGNQVVSLGLWDNFLGKSFNLYAEASTDTPKVGYPTCQSFQYQKCSGIFQEKASGLCVAENNQLEELTCKKNTRKIKQINPRMNGATTSITRFEWVRAPISYDAYYVQALGSDSEKLSLDDPNAKRFMLRKASRPDLDYEQSTKDEAIELAGYMNMANVPLKNAVEEWNNN